MKVRATWNFTSRRSSLLATVLYVVGVLEIIGISYLSYKMTVDWLQWDIVQAIIVSVVVGFAFGGTTLGISSIVEDVHSIMLHTAEYSVDEIADHAKQ